MNQVYVFTIAVVMLAAGLILETHLVSAQTLQTIKPGFLPDCMGQIFGQDESFDIVNSTGFLGIHYLYYGHILVYDYILRPGQNATMLYAEHGGQPSDIQGSFQFSHGDNDASHPGLDIKATVNTAADSTYSKITILADKDAKRGTYWLMLPPGLCSGGSVILLTVGDSIELVPQTGTIKAHVETHSTDDVIVINSLPYMLVNLTLLDPAGTVERAYEIMADPNGNSGRWFTPEQNGVYTAVITSAAGNVTLPFTVSGVKEPQQKIENPTNLYDSPLEQFNSGVLSKFVKCNHGLNLLINTHNFQPACVKETSIARLLNQGWSLPDQCITGPVDTHFTMDVLGMIVIPKNALDVNAGKSYEPQNATVVIGLNNTVEWFNMDDFGSSVTSDDGIFDSGLILPHHTWKYKFECAGKYEYHNVSYPWLKGAVTVLPFG